MPVGFGGAKEELRGAIPLYSDNEQSSGHVDTSPILDGEQMEHRNLAITSRGSLVPGSITIPSDGAAHNVLVAQLELAAGMSWVVVPKVDAIARLKAKINNASDHTLLPGIASVYVNGSFISRLGVPLVNPFESFDCRLSMFTDWIILFALRIILGKSLALRILHQDLKPGFHATDYRLEN
ncbi:hypothetical protein H0H87_009252 [Tephrocybe sp. NHM501043]|nr:hypothetical protein H0H87_009252 [Tephrocybe sp. NHM501043]